MIGTIMGFGANVAATVGIEVIATKVLPAAATTLGKIGQGIAIGCIGMGVGYGAEKAVEELVDSIEVTVKETKKKLKKEKKKEKVKETVNTIKESVGIEA